MQELSKKKKKRLVNVRLFSEMLKKCVSSIADASKTGVAQETVQNAVHRARKAITEREARQILGVSEETAWEEILKVSDNFICFLCFDFLLLLAFQ